MNGLSPPCVPVCARPCWLPGPRIPPKPTDAELGDLFEVFSPKRGGTIFEGHELASDSETQQLSGCQGHRTVSASDTSTARGSEQASGGWGSASGLQLVGSEGVVRVR